jgi:hypothetical protein
VSLRPPCPSLQSGSHVLTVRYPTSLQVLHTPSCWYCPITYWPNNGIQPMAHWEPLKRLFATKSDPPVVWQGEKNVSLAVPLIYITRVIKALSYSSSSSSLTLFILSPPFFCSYASSSALPSSQIIHTTLRVSCPVFTCYCLLISPGIVLQI